VPTFVEMKGSGDMSGLDGAFVGYADTGTPPERADSKLTAEAMKALGELKKHLPEGWSVIIAAGPEVRYENHVDVDTMKQEMHVILCPFRGWGIGVLANKTEETVP
jgi:hypothetical protein